MGRPRSQAARTAAIEATLDLMHDGGLEAVSLERVAAHSGVAKSTLYRHFGGREDLIRETARACIQHHTTPDTGSLEGDLRALFDQYRVAESGAERRQAELMPLLIDAARRDPSLQDVVDEVTVEKQRPIRTVLQLAQYRGEIAADLDLDTAMAIVLGPFTFRRMVQRGDVDQTFVQTVVHSAIAALRATATVPAV